MKLDTFLVENTIESSSIYKQMSSELSGDFSKCFDEISKRFKGFKLTDSYISKEASAEYYSFDLTNGIVDLIIKFRQRNERYYTMGINCVLCDKFCLAKTDQNLSDGNTVFKLGLFPEVEGGFDVSEYAELDNAGHIVEQFIEWYFDLSGEYGKVKLQKTKTNALTGSTSMTGSVYHWVPIVGQFTYDHHPANKYDIEAEVIK